MLEASLRWTWSQMKRNQVILSGGMREFWTVFPFFGYHMFTEKWEPVCPFPINREAISVT